MTHGQLKIVWGIGFSVLLGDDTIFHELERRRISLNIDLAQLLERYKDQHPSIVRIRTELKAIERNYSAAIEQSLAGLHSQLKILTKREMAYEKSLKEFEIAAIEESGRDIQLQVLDREADSARKIYNALLRKINELDVSSNLAISEIQLVEPARLPRFPIRPRKMLNIVLGIIVGSVLGVFLAFFLEYWDRTIRTPDDVERYLNIPVLSAIPIMEAE